MMDGAQDLNVGGKMRSPLNAWPRRRRILSRPLWLAAVLMIVASACQSGDHRSGAPDTTTPPPSAAAGAASNSTTTTLAAPGAGAASLQQAFVAVVAKVRPEVVEISTTEGLGSGVIYDTKGDIVTNDHVVGSATSFTVQLVNGQKLNASLVGAYPPDDLAVIHVSGAEISPRPASATPGPCRSATSSSRWATRWD
jgi:putative serine protease PepD